MGNVCGKSIGGAQIIKHKCADIGETFLTQVAECPFCLKLTIEQAKPKQVETVGVADSTQCPNCGHWGIATRIACGKCGALINSMSAGVAAGSSTPKTQLLGSICPNCGAGNDAVNVFCSNCGQALKTSFQPNSQNITDSSFAANSAPSLENITSGTVSAGNVFEEAVTQPRKTPDNSRNFFLLLLAGIIIVMGLVGLITFNSKKSDYSTTYNSAAANNSNKTTSNAAYNTNSVISKSNSTSALIGRKGRLVTNMNIRSSSGQYGEPLGTHYEDARVQILDVESFNTDDGRYSTWYRVRVSENRCDQKGGNGCGNNHQIYDDFGWMQAEMEGWMNARYITIE